MTLLNNPVRRENMKTVSFKATNYEQKLITRIAQRAVQLAAAYDFEYSYKDAEMDITATHANGNRLDLEAMIEADSFNFAHDVFGIRRHLNRNTGKLENCFRPRFSEQ
jgi:hypothetical protein